MGWTPWFAPLRRKEWFLIFKSAIFAKFPHRSFNDLGLLGPQMHIWHLPRIWKKSHLVLNDLYLTETTVDTMSLTEYSTSNDNSTSLLMTYTSLLLHSFQSTIDATSNSSTTSTSSTMYILPIRQPSSYHYTYNTHSSQCSDPTGMLLWLSPDNPGIACVDSTLI